MTAESRSQPTMAPWWPALIVAAALLWLLRDTAQAMALVWARSDTFMHGFLVPPIAAWLAWRRRGLLALQRVRPMPWLLGAVAAACIVWLLGDLASVSTASQFAMVAILVLSVPALFGWGVTRVLLFPLLFLFFAVPFGEFAVPQLMSWTADVTAFSLRAMGIPIFHEGLEFVIPSGNWSVVEACSGVRYLIASFMMGTLFAYLTYTSTRKRLIFVAVALTLPLVANWIRAVIIVLIGHLSDMRLATGVDHLLYGWVFFGVMIGAMFMIGARWADPEVDETARTTDAGAKDHPNAASVSRTVWWVASGVLLLLLAVHLWSWRLEQPRSGHLPQLTTVQVRQEWRELPNAPMPWVPGFPQPTVVQRSTFDRNGPPVWLWTALFEQPGGEGKLVSSTNTIAPSNDKFWSSYRSGGRAASDTLPAFKTEMLRQGATLSADDAPRVRVWYAYRLGGRWFVSDARAKVQQALQRLTIGHGDGWVVVVATPLDPVADERLESFVRAHWQGLEQALDKVNHR